MYTPLLNSQQAVVKELLKYLWRNSTSILSAYMFTRKKKIKIESSQFNQWISCLHLGILETYAYVLIKNKTKH